MDISTAWPKSHIHTWIYPWIYTWIYPWISISTASLVYIHTEQAQWQYCKWGSWGGGQQSPPRSPSHQLGGLGSAVSYPSGVRRAAPATNRFFAFWCAQTALLRNMRPLSMREAPRPGGAGVLPPALPGYDCASSNHLVVHFIDFL